MHIYVLLLSALFFFGTHTAEAATTGAVFPTSGTGVSESPWSDNDWVTPTNIYADDGATANVTASQYDSGDQTTVLKATGFDFSSIPDGSTINGITVRVNAFYRSGNGSGSLDLCQLLNASGAKVGTNLCSTPTALTTTNSTVITKGGSSNLWGNTLTASWIKDPDFGIALGVLATAANADVDVDYVTIEVDYTLPPLSLSGTLYSDEGSTAITSGKTIKIAIGTTTPVTVASATTDSSGDWTITPNSSGITAGTPVVTWVDGDPATRAAVITTLADASNAVSGLDLYKDHVIVRNEDTDAVTIDDMAIYDGLQDSDVPFIANEVEGMLFIEEGQKFYVGDGDSFTGATTTVFGGDLGNNGTLDLSSGETQMPTDSTISGDAVEMGNLITGSSTELVIHDGTHWTARSASQANLWKSVTYGEGLFVALAESGTNRVMTSPDGITWTNRTAAAANTWTQVTYGEGLFVAVSEDGTNRVMTSPDGITWTSRSAASAQAWSSISYGEGRFVALSFTGTAMYSDDGLSWVSGTASSGNGIYSVTYGNGQFVAVGDNRVETSPDGITWTNQTAAEHNWWNSVAYGDGMYVAVGSLNEGTHSVMSSPDGITWTVRTVPETGSWTAVTHTGDYFVAVAVADVSDQVMTSPDGITWTAVDDANASSWVSVVYGDGLLVAVADSGTNRVMTADGARRLLVSSFEHDGETWATHNVPTWTWRSIAYGNGLFVTVGSGTGVMTSTDGENWVEHDDSLPDNTWESVTFGNDTFVAVSSDGTDRAAYSSDGITWDTTSVSLSAWKSVAYGNGTFVAVAGSGTDRVMTSPDGITWSMKSASQANTWNSVAYGNNIFVAVAQDGTNRVMTSPDGTTWTNRTAASAQQWVGLGYGNGLFVATSWGGDIMTSQDGTTWTSRTKPDISNVVDVAYGGGVYVAVSSFHTTNDRIMTSPDGITWSLATTPVANSLSSVTFAEGKFVAVSLDGTDRVMTSESGSYALTTQTFSTDAEVNDLSITATSTVVAPSVLTINGDYTNDGVFTAGDGTVTVAVENNTVGYDLSSASYDAVSLGVTETNAYGMDFSRDGEHLYVLGYDADNIRWYTLGTPWDISTASYQGAFNVGGLDDFPNAVYVKDDGTKVYFTGDSSDAVAELSLSTPYDITTATYVDAFFFTEETKPFGLAFNADGTRLYIAGDNSDSIHAYTLSPAWDVSTAVYEESFSFSAQDTSVSGIHFSTDGTKLFFFGWQDVYGYTLSTPFDISTASYTNSFSPIAQVSGGLQVKFSDDGVKMFILDIDDDAVYQYTTGTEGTGTPDTDKVFAGNMTGENAFNVFTISAEDSDITFADDAETSDLTIGGTAALNAPSGTLTVNGNLINNGTFSNDGLLVITGSSTVSGTLTGSSTLGNVTATSSGEFFNSAAVWQEGSASKSSQWSAITYGGGTFVAVSWDGDVMSSPDGVTWTTRTQPVGDSWQWVTYGDGLFVAVASTGSNRVMTSPDGITWTSRTAAAMNNWSSVTYGNGLFVAVACGVNASSCNTTGGGYRVMVSEDGIIWTGVVAPEANQWKNVTYGNGLFVAVASTGSDRVMTSPDGITWTSRSAASASGWQRVVYGEGRFVAVSETDTAMSSEDGITWTTRITPGNSDWYGLAYGGGYFAALGDPLTGSTYLMISPDGITWTEVTTPNTNFFISMTYGEGKFVSASTDGTNQVLYSSDGTYGNTISLSSTASTTDLTIGGQTTLIAPAELTISGDYANTGVFAHHNGIVNFDGSGIQAFSGGMTGSSAFNAVSFSGNGTKTFSDNASTSDFTIASGATVEAPEVLTITGDYTNNGTFDSGSGLTYIVGTTTASTTAIASWDITTATYDGVAYSVTSQESQVTSLAFKPDGTKFFINGYNSDAVAEYSLSSAWDVTTASYVNEFSTASQDSFVEKVSFSSDGTKMFALGSGNDRVFQYTLSSAWDVTTASYDSVSFSVTTQDATPFGMTFKQDGTRMYIGGDANNRVYSYTLSTPWDISSASYDSKSFSVNTQQTNIQDVAFNDDGTKMFVSGYLNDYISPYTLSTPWDVTTAVYDGTSISVTSQEDFPDGFEFKPDGSKMYVHGESASDIFPYSLDYSETTTYTGTTTLSGNMTGSSAFNDITIDAPQLFVPDGANWTAQNQSENSTWSAITYGNGTFVALAYTGTNRVMTSPDGITWTSRSASQANSWNSLTYGEGLFVAVAGNGTNQVMTSPDGVTWTNRSAAAQNEWYSVTYGGGQFVAIAHNNIDGTATCSTSCVMTSPDGITWTARTAAAANKWERVVYGEGLYVAIASTGTDLVMTSPDGITWTSRNVPGSTWYGLGYGGGTFVAVAYDNVMTSEDGITWSIVSSGYEANSWQSVTYGGGLFVAVSPDGTNQIMTSSDNGANWTPRASINVNKWWDIVYGENKFVAIAQQTSAGATCTTNCVMTSADGELLGEVVFANNASTSDLSITEDTYVTAPSQFSIAGDYENNGTIDWGNGTTTIHGGTQTFSGNLTGSSSFGTLEVASVDTPVVEGGQTWTVRTAAEANQWHSVTYGNGQFVAVALTGTNRVMTSPDGITWTARTAAAANQWRSVTYGDGLFVAVSQDGTNRVMTSPDGITWTVRTAAEANQWRSVTYGDDLFVAVSSDGTNRVMTSPDGITWTARSATEANTWTSVTYGDGLFVAVSQDGTNRVMTSPDGITWTARAAEASSWISVVHGNGTFVAVAQAGTNRVMSSEDGITWTSHSATEASFWHSVSYGNGLFVAVSLGGTDQVMTSPDGITWTARQEGAASSWRSVTYGNGTFVAVAQSGTDLVMTSPGNTGGVPVTTFTDPVEAAKLVAITPGITLEFPADATSTFASIQIDGAENDEIVLRSTQDGTQWGLDADTQISVTYVDVMDSNACDSASTITAASSTDSGNNDCWDITAPAGGGGAGTISSASNQIFGYGQATTSIAAITITDAETPTITAANDLRITIDTTKTNMKWDTTDTTAVFGGTASGKVSNPVSYEDSGATLVVPVSNDFSGGDTLTISGLSFTQFNALAAPTSTLSFVVDQESGSYDVSTAIFNGISLSVSSQEDAPRAMLFNNNGTTLYVMGSTGDDINAYTLSTPYDISTATFDEIALSVAAQEINPRSMLFNNTGTVLYVMGTSGLDINTYTLSTPYDISTATFDEIAFSVSAEGSFPYDMEFNNTGTVLYVVQASGGEINAYTLSTPYDISTATFDEIAFSVLSEENAPSDIFFNNTGTVLYVVGLTGQDINAYTLSTPYDISTATFDEIAFSVAAQESAPAAALFNNDGTTLYVMGYTGDDINAYTLDPVAATGVHDDKTVAIYGAANLADHTAGQIDNAFSYQNKSDEPLFAFNLAPVGENATITSAVFTLSGIHRIDSSNIGDFKLYRDNNSNGTADASDNQIGGTGVLAITGQSGTITFSTSWDATTTKDYVLTGDVTGVHTNEYLTIDLNRNGVTGTGATTEGVVVPLGGVTSVQHIRGGNKGGGSLFSAEVGDDAPEGDGDIGGGGNNGGGGVGEEDNGEQIGNEPGFKAPTATGELYNEWTNGSNALTSDDVYATAASADLRQSYSVFGFNVPAGNTVTGIEVKLEASGSTGAGTIQVALSWNGDESVTATKATSVLTGSDAVYTLGGASDTWGRSWSPSDLSGGNFFVRVIDQPDQNTVKVDAIQVKPYTQAGGGGGGGGGEI